MIILKYNIGVKRILSISIFSVIALGGAFFIYQRLDRGIIREPIPSPQVYNSQTVLPSSLPAPLTTSYSLPSDLNLAVPFTVQAPHANWEDPYGEFCEEASVLMAGSYIKGWDIHNPDVADQKLHQIKDFELQRFGYHKDTTAEETAVILREFYDIEKVQVIYDPSVEQIKKAISLKQVVIVPAAGQKLGNPYFRQPGPLYHMLVIKGYTKEGNFITNDPGTRRGADFIYSPDILMNAIHDWNSGDVLNGRKVIIIVG